MIPPPPQVQLLPLTDADIITDILQREGGYVNNPADKGGPTNRGITQATLEAYLGHPVSIGYVQSLTEAEARAIYQRNFITDPGFDRITNLALRVALIDIGVNAGPRQATILLQRALGITADGVFGPQTLAATQKATDITRKLAAQRCIYYGNICKADPTQWQFYDGWIARAVSLA